MSIIHTLHEHDTVLIHGTSIEATVHLLKTGIFDFRINDRDDYQGYLFFAPNGKYFINNSLGLKLDDCYWDKSICSASFYAKYNADMHYAISNVQFKPEDISTISNNEDKNLIMPEIRKNGYNFKYFIKLMKECEQRKGVLIGFNEKIFEKNIERDQDVPKNEVGIHLPKGISIDYISGIQPLGLIEEKIIKNLH